MITEDERDADRLEVPYDKSDAETTGVVSREGTSNFLAFVQKHHEIQNRHMHRQLQEDLVEHLWERRGQMNRQQ
jgi:hypothetical protein